MLDNERLHYLVLMVCILKVHNLVPRAIKKTALAPDDFRGKVLLDLICQL